MKTKVRRVTDPKGRHLYHEIEHAGARLLIHARCVLPHSRYAPKVPRLDGFDGFMAILYPGFGHPMERAGAASRATGVRPLLSRAAYELDHGVWRTGGTRSYSEDDILEPGQPIELGPFKVTLHLRDRRIPDRVSFEIEAGRERIVFAGGASSGKTSRTAYDVIAPECDLLILDRIVTGFDAGLHENDIATALTERLAAHDALALASFPLLWPVRIHSIVKAARETGRILVIGPELAEFFLAARRAGYRDFPLPGNREDGLELFVPCPAPRARTEEAARREAERQTEFERATIERFEAREPAALLNRIHAAPSKYLFHFTEDAASDPRTSIALPLRHARYFHCAPRHLLRGPANWRTTALKRFVAELIRRYELPVEPIHRNPVPSRNDSETLLHTLRPRRIVCATPREEEFVAEIMLAGAEGKEASALR